MADLETRVRRLETENRVLRVLGGGVVLVMAVALLTGQAAPSSEQEKLIRRGLILVDEDGRPRASFEASRGQGVVLAMTDPATGRTVRMYLTAAGSGLVLGGSDDAPRILLTTTAHRAMLTTMAHGRDAAISSADDATGAMVSVSSKDSGMAGLHVSTGGPLVSVLDADGTVRVVSGVLDESGAAGVKVNDKSGQRKAGFVVDDKGRVR